MTAKNNDFLPIEDHFLIGDLRTAALVSRQGSIDWLCLPYFDSPSIFGKLLDKSAGCLAIDMPGYKIDCDYLPDMPIVEFKIFKSSSQVLVRDFMVPQAVKKDVNQYLVRSITGVRGQATVKFRFNPKPKYAAAEPAIKFHGQYLDFKVDGGSARLHLPNNSTLTKQSGFVEICVPIKAGQKQNLVLEYIPKGQKPSALKTNLEQKTNKFWLDWVSKGEFFDFCHDHLVRSAITLKLMQFYPTGAIVAAPTTSLPEEIGGIRNWDYRYTWIRDATFSLYSFYVLGYHQEAERFFQFIEKVTQKCADDKFDVSLMYTIWGEPIPKERILDNLSGYKHSAPVRIGNGAAQQFQLDVYGALIDAFYFASKHSMIKTNRRQWRQLIIKLVQKIGELWQKPDHGIWEARVGTKHYTYSKAMAWVGVNRANRLKDLLEFSQTDLKVCEELERSINQWIWRHCYKDGNLLQHPDTDSLDATNFLLVLLQFLDKHDHKTKEIIDITAKQLSYQKAFVYRYHNPDGLAGTEGAFLLCSFWLISALAILEDVKTALDLFKHLEKFMKPHGLWSEEIDPKSKEFLGNYPQAFSHMGYIMTAHYLNKYAKRAKIKLK